MQKTMVLLIFAGFMITSCHKEPAEMVTPETNDQQLVKVVKTTHFSSFNYDDVIEYRYNDAGKLIREGVTNYYRDNNQRITRILNPPNNTNRMDTYVFYADETSGKVAYTICNYEAGGNAYRDSNSYIHNEEGLLVKLMNYTTSDKGIFYLYHYYELVYDTSKNLAHLKSFTVNNGLVQICGGWFDYAGYDNRINPLYSGDEVRMLENLLEVGNSSPNNFTSQNNTYSRQFTYRADGRPSSCSIIYNGNEQFTLTFYYK